MALAIGSAPAAAAGDAPVVLEKIGTRRGLLRPRRVILISPRVRQLLVEEKVKAFETDVAHLV